MSGISSYCIGCILKKQEERIRQFGDETKKSAYMKELCRVIAESGANDSAPVLVARNAELMKKYFGIEDDYIDEKKKYNALMLKYENEIREKIQSAADPLKEALKYSRVGNYIDFGAMNRVEEGQLDMLLSKVQEDKVDEKEFADLKADLEKASRLVFLTDNCGEIVLDKLFIEEIKTYYPQLDVTVIVRGSAVINDATPEDAAEAGMNEVAKVIGNGTNMAGTPLDYIGEEARDILKGADVILAKGQGNFESMNGCGLNIYYLFLCKCNWFVRGFQMKQFEGVLVNEKNLREKMSR